MRTIRKNRQGDITIFYIIPYTKIYYLVTVIVNLFLRTAPLLTEIDSQRNLDFL